jgi:hypothetical protein
MKERVGQESSLIYQGVEKSRERGGHYGDVKGVTDRKKPAAGICGRIPGEEQVYLFLLPSEE